MKSTNQSIAVIGAGSWGTALAMLICPQFETVHLWGRNNAERLQKERCNQRYLPDISFPDNLEVTPDFNALARKTLKFLVVVPSHAFTDTLILLRQSIIDAGKSPDDAMILWGTKGFDAQSGLLLSEVVANTFPTNTVYGCISGPSFAQETAMGLPTGLTVACDVEEDAKIMAGWFRTPSTRVYYSDDLIGVQIGGAVKNVLAIATGICDGLGYGANARAALITRGLAEMIRLGLAMGGKQATFNGLTGVGDLILSCTDDLSRNRRFGLGIGQGKSRSQVVTEIGQEIEGIKSTNEIHRKALSLNIDMPITEQVHAVLSGKLSPDNAVRSLLEREPRPESI